MAKNKPAAANVQTQLQTVKGEKVIFMSPASGHGRIENEEYPGCVLVLILDDSSKTGSREAWMRPNNVIKVNEEDAA